MGYSVGDMMSKRNEKKRCDFRLPKVECIDNGAYPRWAIYCSCGTTIFGNSIKECQDSWRKHAEGKL